MEAATEVGPGCDHMRSVPCGDCGGVWELWRGPLGITLYARHVGVARAFVYDFDAYRLGKDFGGSLAALGRALRNEAHPLLAPRKRTGRTTRRG